MSDIEEHDASELGQFGSLTAEQQAMVNAFAEMIRTGQVPTIGGASNQSQGVGTQGEGARMDSTQVGNPTDLEEENRDNGSLRIETQHGIRAPGGAEETIRKVTKVPMVGEASGLSGRKRMNDDDEVRSQVSCNDRRVNLHVSEHFRLSWLDML